MIIYSISGTNTAQQAIPDGGTQELIFAHMLYTSDATVGNRFLTMSLLDSGSNIVGSWGVGAAITASLAARQIEYMSGIFRETAFVNGEIEAPFPTGLLLPSGFILKFYDEAAVAAGDSMTVTIATKISPQL